jgi:outer membrane translocation and assembly module TamA
MLHVEQAGGWMPGTFDYANVIGEARYYYTMANRHVTFAVQSRYGSITPLNQEADIPLLKRFFLGGSGQMRGWSRFELSPLSASGEPVGGKSLLASTAEIRVPLARRLRGALFVEAGNVWRGDWTLHPHDLLFDAGPGVRIQTPFGLIRLDVGYQLNRLEGLRIDRKPQRRAWRINVGLGEAF